MLRWLGRLVVALVVLGLLLAGPALYFAFRCTGAASAEQVGRAVAPLPPPIHAAVESQQGYERAPEQTYLSFPEWLIVYVAKDFASFTARSLPSGFPYWRSITQFWSNYCTISREVSSRFDTNWDAHLTLYLAGVRHTLGYGIEGLYENTIGRATEAIAPDPPTDEDLFARRFAADYARFLDTAPWHEFPFASRLRRLWTETSLTGPGPLRKWERKLSLSAELGVKAVSGWIVGGGIWAARTAEEREIFAVIARIPGTVPEIKTLVPFPDGTALVAMPRYTPFTEATRKLTGTEARFLDIAGNRDILMTVSAPRGWSAVPPPSRTVFEMDLLLDPDRKRIGLSVPVDNLLDSIRAIEGAGGWVEHIYDY